jgi:hypothetical protein
VDLKLLGHFAVFRLVLASRRSATAFRGNFGHPCRWPSTPFPASYGHPFEYEDRLTYLIALGAKLLEHFFDFHGFIITRWAGSWLRQYMS